MRGGQRFLSMPAKLLSNPLKLKPMTEISRPLIRQGVKIVKDNNRKRQPNILTPAENHILTPAENQKELFVKDTLPLHPPDSLPSPRDNTFQDKMVPETAELDAKFQHKVNLNPFKNMNRNAFIGQLIDLSKLSKALSENGSISLNVSMSNAKKIKLPVPESYEKGNYQSTTTLNSMKLQERVSCLYAALELGDVDHAESIFFKIWRSNRKEFSENYLNIVMLNRFIDLLLTKQLDDYKKHGEYNDGYENRALEWYVFIFYCSLLL